MAAKMELFEDKRGSWRFRVKARNGEIVAQSEAYANKANARRGAISLANNIVDGLPVMDGDRVVG